MHTTETLVMQPQRLQTTYLDVARARGMTVRPENLGDPAHIIRPAAPCDTVAMLDAARVRARSKVHAYLKRQVAEAAE